MAKRVVDSLRREMAERARRIALAARWWGVVVREIVGEEGGLMDGAIEKDG